MLNDIMDLSNTRGITASNRKFEGVTEFLESMNSHDKVRDAIYENDRKVFLEDVDQTLMSLKDKEEETILNEAVIEQHSLFNETFRDFLTEATIDALPIDAKLIDKNRNMIVEKVHAFYEVFEGNLDTSNILVEEVLNRCAKIVNECSDSFEVATILEDCTEKLAESTKVKVEKVIQEEQILSEATFLQENDEIDAYVRTSTTLFKEMNMENVKQALKEHANTENSIATKEDIMMIAYYETVVEYTMLEVFNTAELIKFTEDTYLTSDRQIKQFRLF